jgi:hypothetical protein
MGMFDYIKCEIPLPDGFSGELQTKDFDCTLSTHIIKADGSLELDNGHDEIVPEGERPYPNAEGLKKFIGSLRHIPKLEKTNFHGMLRFYGIEKMGYDSESGKPLDKWHEYIAKFTDGKLMSINQNFTDK